MNAILASVFSMCVIGLMNYMGIMSTRGALIGTRICSTLQYPNTLAAVIGASVFYGLYLAMERNVRAKAVYICVTNILLTTFILTFSRTMYVIFPCFWLHILLQFLRDSGKVVCGFTGFGAAVTDCSHTLLVTMI